MSRKGVAVAVAACLGLPALLLVLFRAERLSMVGAEAPLSKKEGKDSLSNDTAASGLSSEAEKRTPSLAQVKPAPPPPSLSIRVTDEGGVPIEGALISAYATESLIGETQSNGELTATSRTLGSGELSVVAEGFVAAILRVPSPFPDRVDVRLRESWEIRGVVLDPEGQPAGEDLIVLAVGPSHYFNPRAIGASLDGIPLIPVAKTDAFGQFVLRGLDPRKRYRLHAGGRGLVSFDPFGESFAPADDLFVEIVAERAYGALLTFRDGAGDPPKLAPELNGTWHGKASSSVGAKRLHTTDLTGRLLGLGSRSTLKGSFYDKLIVFTSVHDLGDSPLSVRYRGHFPGYLAFDVTFDAPMAIGDIPRHVVELAPSGEGFGEVLVVAQPADLVEEVLPSPGSSKGCKLLLKEIGTGTEIEARLSNLAGGMEEVAGIPFGEYEVTFLAPHQLFWSPPDDEAPLRIRVGPEPTQVQVSLAGLGAIRMRIITQRGVEYDGALVGTHTRTRGKETDAFHFFSSPYNLPLLPPGEYEVRLDGLGLLEDENNRKVYVEAGRLEELVFVVEE